MMVKMVIIVVEALWYKLEGCGFHTREGTLISPIYLNRPATLSPVIYSVSNKNEPQTQKNNVFWS